jgi:phosphatidylglycerophosphate synthase
MIDAALLPLQRRLLAPPAEWLVARGVRADQITVAGLILGLLGAGAAALGLFWLALAGLVLNRLADGLDGAVARLTTPTDRGAFLDIALDFVFYAAFPLGFVLADPAANAVPGAALIWRVSSCRAPPSSPSRSSPSAGGSGRRTTRRRASTISAG